MEQFFRDFLSAVSPALQTLILSCVTVLAGQAVAWVRSEYLTKKALLSSENQYYLELLITQLTHAAEQIYGEKNGAEKKAFVIQKAQEIVASAGLNIDLAQIDATIEGIVFSNPLIPNGK